MNKVMLIVLFGALPVVHAADSSNPYKPTIPAESGQSILRDLPPELQTQIVMIVANTATLDEAAEEIRKLTRVNKEFYTLINDANITKNLIHMLVAKFGGYHETVARALKTQGAQAYINLNTGFLDYLKEISISNSNEIEKMIEPWIKWGVDINFSTASLCPLAVVIKFNKIQPVALVAYLISKGASVSYIDSTGLSLFLSAIRRTRQKISVVGSKLPGQVSVPVTMVDNEFFNVEVATNIVNELLSAARRRGILYTPQLVDQIQIALHAAVESRAAAIVSLLLEAGAQASKPDIRGLTALKLARMIVQFNSNDARAIETLMVLEAFDVQNKQ